jgi:hypothetical protein
MYIVVVIWSKENYQLIACDTEQIAKDWKEETQKNAPDALVHIEPVFGTHMVRPWFVEEDKESNSATL